MHLVNPSIFLSIHGRPESVRSNPENSGAVTIEFEANSCLTIFCGTPGMARDMEAAIASVIAKHGKTDASLSEAA